MKLIIAGSRTIEGEQNFELLVKFMDSNGILPKITEIVSGTAKGVDQLGERLANAVRIPLIKFPAKWDDLSNPDAFIKINSFGKRYDAKAGHRRNRIMAEYADALLLMWDGKSSGSMNMKNEMVKLNKPIYEVIIK